MMTRFIAMCILPDKTRCIAICLLVIIFQRKKIIKFLTEFNLPAGQANQPFNIMRNIPKILPGITFGERISTITSILERVK